MLMFWVDESAEVTAGEDAAMMIAVKSWVAARHPLARTARVEVRPFWDAPSDN